MAVQLAAAITAFVIAFLIIPVIIKFSINKNIVDVPGRRKIHKKVTPSMGGIAIFSGFFVASLIWIEFAYWGAIKFVLVALFVVFFIGVRDDLVPLRATVKLLGQLMATSLIVFLFDLRIVSLYGLFGVYELPMGVSYALTFLTVIVITNSFNLIDGLDGLAGVIASIALLAFGIYFFLNNEYIFSLLAFCMMGGTIAFLIFNWDPSEIFMGDTGALVIGMMLSILTIHFINVNYNLADSAPYKFQASIATAACFIIIPLIDTARIIILRVSKGKSPFAPDKSHIHHAIMRLGKTHSQTTVILGLTHIGYVIIAIVCHTLSDNYLVPIIILFSIVLSVFLDRLILSRLDSKEEN